ncbi:MAG: helix-turn-helix domain-containing protein [Akkermansiaceae bacterium]|nr:helix-turn-helix domain-containing protein [Akkermansiaceae bacterium]
MEHTSKALDAPSHDGADDSVQQKPETLTNIQDVDTSTWITTKQASENYECAQSTLKRWIKAEELKSHQIKPRSAYLVDPEHVERMLKLRSHVTSIFHPAKIDDVTPHTTGDTDVTSHPTTKDVTSPQNQTTEDDKVYLTKPFPPEETTQSKPATANCVGAKHSDKHQTRQKEGAKPPRGSQKKKNRRPQRKFKTDLNHVVKMAMSLPVGQRLSLRNQLTSNLDSVI